MELRMKFLKRLLETVEACGFSNSVNLGPLMEDEDSGKEIPGSATILIYDVDGNPYLITYEPEDTLITVTAVQAQLRVLVAKKKTGWIIDTVIDESVKMSSIIELCKVICKVVTGDVK